MIGLQMLRRMEFVHRRRVLHRDVKPENFLQGLKGAIAPAGGNRGVRGGDDGWSSGGSSTDDDGDYASCDELATPRVEGEGGAGAGRSGGAAARGGRGDGSEERKGKEAEADGAPRPRRQHSRDGEERQRQTADGMYNAYIQKKRNYKDYHLDRDPHSGVAFCRKINFVVENFH